MTSSYKSILTNYLTDVAADSGTHTNVYSTLNEYWGSNGAISYQIQLGTPIDDAHALPANGCNLNPKDRSGIYADGSGYDACLDDAQVAAERNRVRAANGLPIDLAHIYVLFLAKHVETCFFAGSAATKANQACTINHHSSATAHTTTGPRTAWCTRTCPSRSTTGRPRQFCTRAAATAGVRSA